MGAVAGELIPYCDVAFQEGRYTIKTLTTDDEREAAYRLRHKVFADALSWVPGSPDELETDNYDARAINIGLFNEHGAMLGAGRLLPACGPIMLEQEFQSFLWPWHEIRKDADTVEITRVVIDPAIHDRGARLILLLFKGMYQWGLANRIHYAYLEVKEQFLRVITAFGFPCETIGPVVELPPANVRSQAALLDLDRFRKEATTARPEFLWWMTVPGIPSALASPTNRLGQEPIDYRAAGEQRRNLPSEAGVRPGINVINMS